MFERLSKDGRVFEGITREHLKQYAEAGLRTLVVAYRELDEKEFESWEQEFLNAQASVTADRDALVDAAAQKIERDLILLGVTAVEDKLQKGVSFNLCVGHCLQFSGACNLLFSLCIEPDLLQFQTDLLQVPECIDKLAKAGIKIWVLTGDKMETAINIGLVSSNMMQLL